MATTKTRVNLSLSKSDLQFLSHIAKRDQMPRATKARQLMQMAMEIEEDTYLAKVAKERDVPGVKYLSHEEFWRKALAA